jgi:hypothetical protein
MPKTKTYLFPVPSRANGVADPRLSEFGEPFENPTIDESAAQDPEINVTRPDDHDTA